MKTPRQVADAWLEAWKARDAEALVALYHDDAVNHQVAFGDPVVGRDALLRDFTGYFTAFPNSYTHPENILIDGEWAAIEWTGGGTFTGPLGDIEPNGKSFKLQGCGFLRIVEGKIKFQRGYIDRQTWFSQLGLPAG